MPQGGAVLCRGPSSVWLISSQPSNSSGRRGPLLESVLIGLTWITGPSLNWSLWPGGWSQTSAMCPSLGAGTNQHHLDQRKMGLLEAHEEDTDGCRSQQQISTSLPFSISKKGLLPPMFLLFTCSVFVVQSLVQSFNQFFLPCLMVNLASFSGSLPLRVIHEITCTDA